MSHAHVGGVEPAFTSFSSPAPVLRKFGTPLATRPKRLKFEQDSNLESKNMQNRVVATHISQLVTRRGGLDRFVGTHVETLEGGRGLAAKTTVDVATSLSELQ